MYYYIYSTSDTLVVTDLLTPVLNFVGRNSDYPGHKSRDSDVERKGYMDTLQNRKFVAVLQFNVYIFVKFKEGNKYTWFPHLLGKKGCINRKILRSKVIT